MAYLRSSNTAKLHAAVTPHNSTNITNWPVRALRIGVGGVVAVVGTDDVVVNYTCVDGEVLTVATKRVNSTNTTATGIVAWY
jgi:hypothetical protein